MRTFIVLLAALLGAGSLLAADLQSLLVSRRQLEIQLALEQEQLSTARNEAKDAAKDLKDKKKAEGKIYQVGLTGKTQKGTGDSSAQTTINELQVKVSKATAAADKHAATVAALKQQMANLDAQIVALDPSWRPSKKAKTEAAAQASTPIPPAPAPAPAIASTPAPLTAKVKIGHKVMDRSSVTIATITGIVVKYEKPKKWPGYAYKYSGTWLKTLEGDTFLIAGGDEHSLGDTVILDVVPNGKQFEGMKMFDAALPVKE